MKSRLLIQIDDSSSSEEVECGRSEDVDHRSLTVRLRELRERTLAAEGAKIPPKRVSPSVYNPETPPQGRLSCPHAWCDFVAISPQGVRDHVAATHIHKAFGHLTHESRVLREVRKWGLTVATPVTMYAFSQGWLTDTSRKYSRVDMMVMDVISCVLLLEVDESAHQYKDYTVTCECSRMADINAYLRLRGYEQPIYWLRYNPDGPYFVGNEKRSVSREERELALKYHIFSMMEPDFVPVGNENICYLFYSRVSEYGPPTILEHPDYPDILKSVVSWDD